MAWGTSIAPTVRPAARSLRRSARSYRGAHVRIGSSLREMSHMNEYTYNCDEWQPTMFPGDLVPGKHSGRWVVR